MFVSSGTVRASHLMVMLWLGDKGGLQTLRIGCVTGLQYAEDLPRVSMTLAGNIGYLVVISSFKVGHSGWSPEAADNV